jgi:hypothetical protein
MQVSTNFRAAKLGVACAVPQGNGSGPTRLRMQARPSGKLHPKGLLRSVALRLGACCVFALSKNTISERRYALPPKLGEAGLPGVLTVLVCNPETE